MGTSWANDVETTLFQRDQRWYNVVSTSLDHDVPAGIVTAVQFAAGLIKTFNAYYDTSLFKSTNTEYNTTNKTTHCW